MSVNLDAADELLTTTRTVRRRLDLSRMVPIELVEECLRIAVQAPTASNLQMWRWLILTDPEQKKSVADWYRQGWEGYKPILEATKDGYAPDDPRHEQHDRSVASAQYLADHMHDVPVLVIPCVTVPLAEVPLLLTVSALASVLPATWSLMLAARARGLGTAMTTLTVQYQKEIGKILELPSDVSHCCVVPLAYYTGASFSSVQRLALSEVAYHDRWGLQFPS